MQLWYDLQVPCCIKGRYVIRFTVTSQRTTAQVQCRAGEGISHFTSILSCQNNWFVKLKNIRGCSSFSSQMRLKCNKGKFSILLSPEPNVESHINPLLCPPRIFLTWQCIVVCNEMNDGKVSSHLYHNLLARTSAGTGAWSAARPRTCWRSTASCPPSGRGFRSKVTGCCW